VDLVDAQSERSQRRDRRRIAWDDTERHPGALPFSVGLGPARPLSPDAGGVLFGIDASRLGREHDRRRHEGDGPRGQDPSGS
jgi:hypothetical protein